MKKFLFLLLTIGYILTPVIYGSEENNELKDRLINHVRILASDSLTGRGLGTTGAIKAREYILSQFEQAGIKPLASLNFDYVQNFDFRLGNAWIPATNIVGVIEGSDPNLKNEYILIGAHFDHLGFTRRNGEKTIFPGADDNASGVAAIIEIGRQFAASSDKPGRSILIVAFDAEESGLYGARHFVRNSPVPLESIKLMYSFDMVGMLEANRGLHLTGKGTLSEGPDLAESIARNHSINLRRTGSRIERRTDTAPFGDAGIPAVHVFTGTKSPYHKPEDTYDLLDYEGMVKIHHFMFNLLSELSFAQSLEPTRSFVRQTGDDRAFFGRLSAGVLANTGSGFHRFEDEFFRANSLLSASAGMFFQLPFGNRFTFQPEVLFDLNGSQAPDGNFRRYSLTFPMNIQIGTPRSSGSFVRLYGFGGPYFRYNLWGTYGGESISFDEFNQQEWGYSLGIGMQVLRINFAFTYRNAIDGIYKDSEVKQIASGSFFTIGYAF